MNSGGKWRRERKCDGKNIRERNQKKLRWKEKIEN